MLGVGIETRSEPVSSSDVYALIVVLVRLSSCSLSETPLGSIFYSYNDRKVSASKMFHRQRNLDALFPAVQLYEGISDRA